MTVQSDSISIGNRASIGDSVLSPGASVPELSFPLLLALSDDEAAPAAIRMAAALASARGAKPTVLRALGDVRAAEASLGPLAGAVLDEVFDPRDIDACRDELRARVTAVAGPVGWPLEVNDLSPIDAIIREVQSLSAGLIVMGLRRHGVMRRLISRDLLAEVLRVARVPVLAVRPDTPSLPRRVVVAIDFSSESIRAAHLARALITADGAMALVHVSPANSDTAQARLEQLADSLAPTPGMTMTTILLHGDVLGSIELFAQAMSADLLAFGSGQHTLLERLTEPRISMQLAHTARWSTLIVPALRD